MPHRLGARIALAGLSVALTAGGIRSATQAPRPPIEQRLPAHLFEIVDRHRTRAVRADHAVDTADRDLSGAHRMPAMRRQNLLADGLGHAWLVASVERNIRIRSPAARASTTVPTRLLDRLMLTNADDCGTRTMAFLTSMAARLPAREGWSDRIIPQKATSDSHE